jgi:hypothetical protein
MTARPSRSSRSATIGTEFVGEIAVLGESWNGSHTVSAVAESGELVSAPWVDMFTVDAPDAGSEAWKKKSTITPSKGNAVAVDAQGEVYELFTEWKNPGTRCHVRRRDAQGQPVWPQDAVALAPGVSCGGEDIKVAPDGTLWVLVNTVVEDVNRWQLFHLDPDGVELDAPQVGDFQEFGRGLDVNAAGDLLLCGVRPALLGEDAWVRWLPPVVTGGRCRGCTRSPVSLSTNGPRTARSSRIASWSWARPSAGTKRTS